ncbi:putative acyl-CoA dehydrogenase FadE [Moraxella macacae 0408225]|uniref:Putative acyl-CoA dehydrogenase FadE n=1 Tax=Moraxella macacae 0408225 TaxID=1230338 RepID=L2F7D4_9GAMM|nr:acyl-CoA dehydrogenase family protein [Moraxella macacae]ELA08815.1 putative acyl-CoA dehydrogenase FadE [Moraxella macacae 0408225]
MTNLVMTNSAQDHLVAQLINDCQNHQLLLNNVSQLANKILTPKVLAIDKGYYPLPEMSKLAKAGAFAPHLTAFGNRFDVAIDSTAKIAEVCGTTGFLSWCHQVMGLYLDQSENSTLAQKILPNHLLGNTFGGTALSNPMKTFANIESMILRAKKVDGGYVVSGTLPWISHIAPNQYCGAIATVESDTTNKKDVFFLLRFDETKKAQWQLNPCPAFSGMEGSSTWQIKLNDYFIPNSDLIADPVKPFIEKVRGAFVLMQMGIGIGIIQGAINDINAVEDQLGHVNQFLADQADGLQEALNSTIAQTHTLAKTPFDSSKDFFLDVLDLRCQGAKLSLKATQASLLHQGARGYLMTANPQRRIREAHFVAIVTPAIKHLRALSHQLMREISPN